MDDEDADMEDNERAPREAASMDPRECRANSREARESKEARERRAVSRERRRAPVSRAERCGWGAESGRTSSATGPRREDQPKQRIECKAEQEKAPAPG